MNIDNNKKTRIALKILVSFGDYQETLKQFFGGFLHLLEKCKSKDSTVGDFLMLEHMTFHYAGGICMGNRKVKPLSIECISRIPAHETVTS